MPKYEIRDSVDVFHVQRCVRDFCGRIGFSRRECGELAIVASELTSNILKYGIRGSIDVESVSDGRGAGVSIVATDCGPQFRDLSAAMQDGYDDRGPIDPLLMLSRKGIGGGLGAIVRFTHSFRVEPLATGKKVYVVRYVRQP